MVVHTLPADHNSCSCALIYKNTKTLCSPMLSVYSYVDFRSMMTLPRNFLYSVPGTTLPSALISLRLSYVVSSFTGLTIRKVFRILMQRYSERLLAALKDPMQTGYPIQGRPPLSITSPVHLPSRELPKKPVIQLKTAKDGTDVKLHRLLLRFFQVIAHLAAAFCIDNILNNHTIKI